MSRKKDPNVYQPKDHFSVPETPKESARDFVEGQKEASKDIPIPSDKEN